MADSIRHAANENESYVDQSIQPPLELLEGTIHDIKWENSANAIKQRLSWITVHISLLSKHYLILRVWLYPNPIYPVCR